MIEEGLIGCAWSPRTATSAPPKERGQCDDRCPGHLCQVILGSYSRWRLTTL
jgi:hypothetical protein